MLEVTQRWGLSKTATWSINGNSLETPVILYGEEKDNSLTLSNGKGFDISVSDSFFKPRDDVFSIPVSFAYTGSAGNRHIESKGGSPYIQVIYDQEPDPVAELYILGNSLEYLGRGKDLVKKILELRERIPFHKLIYLPGIALPNNISLFTYIGVDIFDSVYVDHMGRLGNEVSDWLGFSGNAENNRKKLEDEVRLIKNGISCGRIRELVEMRVRSEPWLVESLRYLDSMDHLYEDMVPVVGDQVYVTTREGFYRPDIKRFRQRINERYKPPQRDLLILLPCSASKPYFNSRSHRRFRSATNNGNWTNIHEVVLTSPLGIVPRELELFYPAKNYDIPVSHEWYSEEKETILEMLDTLIERGSYQAVVSHLPADMNFVREHIDCIDTAQGEHPTYEDPLKRLSDTVMDIAGTGKGDIQRYLHQNMQSIANFQFGENGHSLVEDATIKGRYPEYKIIADDEQRGMIVFDKGLISLTLYGGELLMNHGINIVHIEDFVPKGSVFAVGIKEADRGIAPGDECVVVHDGELRGVGVAIMSGREMSESSRGVAVNIRHHV